MTEHINRSIRNQNQARQLIVFNNCQYKKFSPTDIDFCFEYRGKYLILGEVKRKGNDILDGQRYALENIVVNWCQSTGNKALYMVVEHDTPSDKKEIDISSGIVKKLFINTEYKELKREITCSELLYYVGKKWGIEFLTKLTNTMEKNAD
tara:strand:+ start:325 stop:774 length:450 start_codon:yes stop_codon:yes gene_type:complete